MRRLPGCRSVGRIALLWLCAAAPQAVGSWMLLCPGHGGCLLQHETWIVPPGSGHPSVALQVQRRGDWLVPVVALRGVTAQAAVGGLLLLHPLVVLRFTPGPPIRLSCGMDAAAVVCAPEDPAASAAALARATSVQADLVLTLPGGTALPAQRTTLALSGTAAALAKLGAARAAGESLPAEPGLDWIGFLDKVLRAAGFADGAAGLVTRLSGR